MRLAIYHLGTGAVWANALFASTLQRSDQPTAGQVRQAVAAAIYAYGAHGCAERMAQEFGDHPETAVARMRWARAVAREVIGTAPEPAQNGSQRRPALPVNQPRVRHLARR
jgi:hypothetical protein